MGLRSGMVSQIGFVDEVTYGTPVTSGMTFLPLVDESLGQEIERVESAGIRSGRRVITSDEWAGGQIKVGGDVGLELTNKNLRTVMKHCFGAESGSGPYTYSAGDLTSLSFTTQVGKPGVGGTIHPFTYAGCKVSEWEIAAKEGEIATLGLTIIAQKEIGHRSVTDGVTTSGSAAISSATAAFGPDDVGKPISGTGIPASTTILSVTSTTATLSANATASGTGVTFTIGLALATVSYSSSISPFHYDQATLTIGGSTVRVKELTFKGNNGLEDSRRFLGQRYIEEPLEKQLREYTAQLSPEFTDRTQYQRFVNGLEAAVVATFTNGTDSVTVTTNVRFDGESPKVAGRELLAQSLPCKCIASTASDSSAISVAISQA